MMMIIIMIIINIWAVCGNQGFGVYLGFWGVLFAQLSSRTTTHISFTSCWRCCFGLARGLSQASSKYVKGFGEFG